MIVYMLVNYMGYVVIGVVVVVLMLDFDLWVVVFNGVIL